MSTSAVNSRRMITEARPYCAQRGVTLIELMIVVVIVAILAAIAYPSYSEQVRKSRRTEAKTLLFQAQTLQERFYTQNNRYATNMTALGFGANPQLTENGWYNVATTSTAPPNPTFTLTATALLGQAGDRCGNLSITSLGVKGKTGTATVQDCW